MKLRFSSLLCLAATLALPPAFAQNTRVRTFDIQRSGSSYLGIGISEITPERARTLNLKEVRGAEVAYVEDNSPAAKAGLKQGDVVLEYNGMAVEGMDQLERLVRETPPGHQVKLTIWRNGASQTVTAAIGEREGTYIQTPNGGFQVPPIPPMPPIDIPRFQWSVQSPLLGIEGESLGQEKQLANYFGVKDGVLIKQVLPNSAAEKAGLKAGDVVTRVDGANVSSTRDITAQLRSNRSPMLTLVRDHKEMTMQVNIENQTGNRTPAGERF